MSIKESNLAHLKKKNLAFTVYILSLLLPAQALAEAICKEVGNNWEWFGDHAVSSIEYVIAFDKSQSSKISVGTGIFISGKPRGKIQDLAKEKKIDAYGIGAIHIKNKRDGKVKVCVTTGKVSAISFYSDNF
tara:strand:+ start:477 stop:872 length:396 start_codon:yes stop_codon:yes gene_type:complete